MPYDPPPELASLSLAEIAELVEARKLPPLDKWSPHDEGLSHMRIAADGHWFHEGGEIKRPAMVRAFASLLMRDKQGQHWLVTPHQKLTIEVEDAAFVGTDVRQDGDSLAFRLNTDDLVIAGPDHPIVARGSIEEPAIYLGVRHGTEARLNRSTWAQLVDLVQDDDQPEVRSGGMTFALLP